jgi:hypothetical protein
MEMQIRALQDRVIALEARNTTLANLGAVVKAHGEEFDAIEARLIKLERHDRPVTLHDKLLDLAKHWADVGAQNPTYRECAKQLRDVIGEAQAVPAWRDR